MRDEDWTLRGAEGRLAEPSDLRAALGLQHGPDDTTVSRFLRRRDEAVLEQILRAVAQRLVPPPTCPTTVAADATGVAPGAIGTSFGKRAKDRGEGFPWRHWRKWTRAVDGDRPLLVARTARRGPTDDGATLRPRAAAHRCVPLALVLAEAECDGERHQQHIRQILQAQSAIPAKRGGAGWHIQGVRAHMRQACPVHLDSRRALIESLISVVKRQRPARAPGRSLATQGVQALLRGIAYNIYRW